jgi:hypothetical protein
MATFADLDEVTFDLDADGENVREQLARRVWEARGWATVACAYRERARDGTWRTPKLALIKLRRVHDAWKRESSVTLDGHIALELAGVLDAWREHFAAEVEEP